MKILKKKILCDDSCKIKVNKFCNLVFIGYNIIVMIMLMIISFIILFICFLIWTFWMVKGKTKKIDDFVYKNIHFGDMKTRIMLLITTLASSKYLAFMCVLFLIFIPNKKFCIILIIHLILTSLLIGIIKHIFKRERPNIHPLVKEKGYSYPSGHTFSSVSFYGFIIFLFLISDIVLSFKILAVVFFVSLILQIGYSRIYLGVHYFSDVVGGLLIGSSYTLLYVYFIHFILNIL